MELLNSTYYDNTLKEWLIAAGILCLSTGILRIVKAVLVNRLNYIVTKTNIKFANVLLDLVKSVRLFFLFIISIYFASLSVILPETATDLIRVLIILGFLVQGGIWGGTLIHSWVNRFKSQKLESDPASVTTITALGFVARLALWTVLLLLAMENLGVNVTGLVAGLGIGGIAIALAIQNILGDLFASLSIVLDKPFVIGDFIVLEDYVGTVQKVGLKTTRIQSLSGEQLVISNSDLLSSRIRNFKRMQERRVVFTLGVTYQTPYGKLAVIPQIIKEIIENTDNTRVDRVHFKEYGDFSLVFEVVYYVNSRDYNIYMDIQQHINLAIHRHFEELGVSFAYPTQTIFMQEGGHGASAVTDRKSETEKKKMEDDNGNQRSTDSGSE